MTELSDELLVAYVDGQLARAQSRAVEKVLKQDDVLARRVDALKAAHGRLEAAFEAILAGEVEEISQYAAQAAEKPPRVLAISLASAALGLCVGFAAAAAAPHFWPERAGPAPLAAPAPVLLSDLPPKQTDRLISSWQDDVARSEALLSRASLEVGLDSQGNRDLVAFELAGAIGPDLDVPDLEPQGFHFVRGALLQYGEKPLAQMLYLPDQGNPLALYAMAGDRDSEPVLDRAGPIAMVSWTRGGISYLLAQNGDADALLRIAGKLENEPPARVPAPPAQADMPSAADAPAPAGGNDPAAKQDASASPAAAPAQPSAAEAEAPAAPSAAAAQPQDPADPSPPVSAGDAPPASPQKVEPSASPASPSAPVAAGGPAN